MEIRHHKAKCTQYLYLVANREDETAQVDMR